MSVWLLVFVNLVCLLFVNWSRSVIFLYLYVELVGLMWWWCELCRNVRGSSVMRIINSGLWIR